MKKKGTVITIIFMTLLAVGVIWYFIHINTTKEEEKTEASYERTELDKLLERDLEKEYPPTAREVLKFYSRILCQLYGENEIEEEKIEALADQVRILYCKELLEENSREEQINELKKDIKEYHDASKRVQGYQIEKANSAISWKEGEKELQRLIAVYTVMEKKQSTSVYEKFILCKEDEKWKIVGWEIVDGAEMDFY